MISKLSQAKDTAPAPSALSLEQIGHDERLLAEAVRFHEDAQGFAISDPNADSIAQNTDGDLEHRIIVRAHALSIATDLGTALMQLRTAYRIVIVIGIIVASVAGATAARVALATPNEGPVVNFFWVLGSLLGVPTIALMIWLSLALLKPGASASGSLGHLVFLLGRRISQWLHKGPMQIAAIQAVGSVYTRTPIGRWAFSAISHALWMGFMSTSLILVLLILSTKQYNFTWETTILSEQSYITLTRTIAAIPERLGFSAPDAEQITTSHWTNQDATSMQSREAWSSLLVGSIVAYGLLPRLLLLGFCLFAHRRAINRFQLDTELPGYARLETRLMPAAQSIGVIDPDYYAKQYKIQRSRVVQDKTKIVERTGPVAIMGVEIEPPSSNWPPSIKGVEWLDLGFIDSRDDRRKALEQVRFPPTPLRSVIIVCSVATTPDRGIRGFFNQVQASSAAPVVILLTEGQRLRDRGHQDEITQRLEDWRTLATSAKIAEDCIVDIDLDHLTETSRSKLATLMGGDDFTSSQQRHIEQAFDLIIEHAQDWKDVPDANLQAELHRGIAKLYANERDTWKTLLHARIEPGGDLVGQLKSSANQMLDLLPERLRFNPKWSAAGALAGAMGCVAAATLVSPAAIATLPMWAGLGAALSIVVKPKQNGSQLEEPAKVDLAEAINSAALFAILLELQGCDEIRITRIIDQVAGDQDPPVISSANQARQWLNTLRHRFDLAQATEHST